MRILLFGKDGQLGRELQRSLGALGELVALHAGSTDFCGDLNDLAGVSDTVLAVRPDVVVNAAAWTDVDKAETAPELVRTINALAPGALAQAATRVNAWLVHYSSDYVFDGSGNRPWKEEDVPHPLNVYGKSKLEGDTLVAANCPRHLIFRTSWMYSVYGDNFAKKILRQARARVQLTVVNDQMGAPTGADLVADMTAHAIECVMKRHGLQGLYHLAAGGQISWHGYARFVIGCALRAGWELRATVDSVEAVPSSAYPASAMRPLNSRLDTTKFQSAFNVVLPDWQQGVKRMLMELK
ncbi:MAG: dTDP-4-dehydrorhamnose reductase [Polaromonas sp.]